MGILRADLLTHSQLSNTSGSIQLDGTTDFIQVPSSNAWRIGNANGAHKSVTIEWWIYLNTTSGYHNAFDINYTGGLVIEGTNGVYSVYGGGQTLINEGILDAAVANRWYHYALVIHGGPASTPKSIFLYRDGKLSGAGKIDSNVALGSTSNNLSIGARQSNGANSLNGFISNFRWSDEVVYNSEFTVPKFNLKALPSTLLLCCQSSTSATEAAVSVTGSVTASGNATHSSFNPGLKDDITDTGVVFDGFGNFATSTYMVPPSGKTTERNRGRGIYGLGGFPSYVSTIDFLAIQSTGNAQVFGDLTIAASFMGAAGNQTRSVFSRRYNASGGNNTMDFVTIATTSNAIDFGDATTTAHAPAGCGNNTRGLFGGGATTNILEFITFATAGNAQDFGDLYSKRDMGGLSNSTRGVFAGGGDAPQVNTIQFVTISTTGNGSDFGDLTQETQGLTGSSNSTRGIFAGGYTPTLQNTIQFITIATTGNATDFGDLTFTSFRGASCSSPTRSVIMRGWSPAGNVDDICFIEISSTGNASDFGDKTSPSGQMSESGTSDCHGGLS